MKKSQPEHLGKKIKKIRAFNGMTQEELAQAINKTRSMVSHIERTGEVNHHTLQEIAKVLKLPVEKIQEYDIKHPITLNEIGDQNGSAEQALIIQLKEEIAFLKGTIQNQWKLLFELAK
ncbi:MAG: hypothetical protein JWN78_3306 [Bacteroidota bacterium]|nr:hypothetical protein [Bacteroidota bacterium]